MKGAPFLLVPALAASLSLLGCESPASPEEIQAAWAAVESAQETLDAARKVGAAQYRPMRFSALEDAQRLLNEDSKILRHRYVSANFCEGLKERAEAIRSAAKSLLWEVRRERFMQYCHRLLGDVVAALEDPEKIMRVLLIAGLVAGGLGLVIFLPEVINPRRNKKTREAKMDNNNSLAAVREARHKTGAASVDLGYTEVAEAAKERAIARRDKRQQVRLRRLVEKRIKTGEVLKEAILQEGAIQRAKNSVYELRGDYAELPLKEKARIEREIAEEESKFYEAKVKTAEAQKKLKEMDTEGVAEVYQRAMTWHYKAHWERSFRDPEYREKFAATYQSKIIDKLKEVWTREYEIIMEDGPLVALLQRAFPEVLEWLEARLEVVRLAERFAVSPPAKQTKEGER